MFGEIPMEKKKRDVERRISNKGNVHAQGLWRFQCVNFLLAYTKIK